ncbi:MAG: DUF3148 domain-containing protein [Cyanobacteria bacterium P01_F01_bin.86]
MSFVAGDRVRLTSQPPYFKTADPMPMLRPPDLIPVGQVGIILEQRPGGYWVVKFERGAFLVDEPYLEQTRPESSPEQVS